MYLISFCSRPEVLDSQIKISDEQIKSSWKFDRLNSKLLMFDFDKNKNKKFDKEEKEEFIKAHFFPLEKNNYNIFLANDIDEFKVNPKNIDVNFTNKRVEIIFDIDYKMTDATTICTMDEKIYMAYKLIDIETNFVTDIQRSEYDYCIGVSK